MGLNINIMNLPETSRTLNNMYEKAYQQGMEHSIRILELYLLHPNGIQKALVKLKELIKEDKERIDSGPGNYKPSQT